MYSVTLIYLGTPTERFYREALDEYEKRLGRFCRFTEKCIKPEPLPASPSEKEIRKALAAEKVKLCAALPKNAYRVALCIEGKTLSSEELSDALGKVSDKGTSEIAFIVGSSFGLDEDFKKECDLRLSMSRMTFAHSLAAVMLVEQIYRAFCIQNGDKYHK